MSLRTLFNVDLFKLGLLKYICRKMIVLRFHAYLFAIHVFLNALDCADIFGTRILNRMV